ncbi:hypothetical protein M427DRAFT_42088 [Gonapodya prolifera JEL478]|uniref:FAS1 domain-containing protein n=1 Tax=Gonapodya prolifera (strain JEL478) TaxID=1344416 RepID=A0A139ARZ7_GONPJ|nr:hypothetical protein M427DRAFT_42088 [Gonapodya prolifera JEL478]|eukprot:KXS19323.1 hypothetical protein M427DRAFT_42088 [Gonapodya prolifera JEL478]
MSQVLRCDSRGGQHFVNIAKIIESNLGVSSVACRPDLQSLKSFSRKTANGMIHVINRVLVHPPDLFELSFVLPSELSVFTSAVQRVGLDCIIKSGEAVTVFAPTNGTFHALSLRDLLCLFSPLGRSTLNLLTGPKGNATLIARAIKRSGWISYLGKATQKVFNTVGIRKTEVANINWRVVINDKVEVWFADTTAENGVAHLTNRLPVPPGLNITQEAEKLAFRR